MTVNTKELDFQKAVNKVSATTILGNVLLSALKLIAGVFGHSGAMISDAVHSLSDVITTVIAWLGVRLSKKQADKEHPYGHDRFECLASLILGALLLVTGIMIGYTGLKKIFAGNYQDLAIPGTIALIAAIVSIVVKEGMFWYTRYYAKKLNSAAFMADAWHHRSDALSSIGSFIGIGGAMLGYPILDPVASVAIAVCIIKVSYDIYKDAVSKIMDTACDEKTEDEIREFIRSQDGVVRLDMLHTRLFGNAIYVDAEIAADADLNLRQAHEIAERVHIGVENNFENVKHVMVHVNPAD
ncbi:MAG: cation transporter [Lachnospiraceae bacterium]|jgi:cation diffusion facilitator family transporter|nr:cation transporter [Lachnospiraceae bacterium]